MLLDGVISISISTGPNQLGGFKNEQYSAVEYESMPKQTNQRSLFLRHGSRLCDETTCPHPDTDIDGRCFRLNVGRTVLSSSTNTGEPTEVEPRNEGRRPGLGPATAGADTGRGISTCHDIPSRSANSVFTPANERRKSAHCAWKDRGHTSVIQHCAQVTRVNMGTSGKRSCRIGVLHPSTFDVMDDSPAL